MAYKDGVPNEEDGGVVSNQVPVSLLSVELDSKATRITNSVSTTRLTTYVCTSTHYVCVTEIERDMILTKTTVSKRGFL